MDADLVAAADALAVQKLQAQDYRNAIAASAEATEAFRAATLAAQQAQLDAFVAASGPLHTRDQETWLRLYEMHLKTRLGPAIISSTTSDAVAQDIVNDAFAMTQQAYALVKQHSVM